MNPSNKKIIGIFAALIAVLLVISAAFTIIYGVYVRGSDNSVIRSVAKTLSLPIAKIGKQPITYQQFMVTRDAVHRFINSEAGKSVQASIPPEKILNWNILEQLIRQAMVQEIANQKNVTVSEDDVRAVFADVVKQAASSTTPDVAQYLYDNYGWNEQDFRDYVLRPALLEQKVGVEISKDKQGDPSALEALLTERRKQPDVVVYAKFVEEPTSSMGVQP